MNSGVSRCLLASIVTGAVALVGCGSVHRSGGPAAVDAGTAGAAGIAGIAGTAGAAGTAGTAGAAGEAGADTDESLPLSFTGGVVSNIELDVQGIVFAEADSHTAESMTSNLTVPIEASVVDACIKGTAAKVDKFSDICKIMMFTSPATDCFGEYWGADIAIYLNQPSDTDAGAGGEPLPFDASTLKGFSFEITGGAVPARSALRFQVEAEGRLFCSSGSVKIDPGTNRVLFEQLPEDCFRYPHDPATPTAETVKSELLKISWHVVTNDNAAVPFDFCVSNVRALLR